MCPNCLASVADFDHDRAQTLLGLDQAMCIRTVCPFCGGTLREDATLTQARVDDESAQCSPPFSPPLRR